MKLTSTPMKLKTAIKIIRFYPSLGVISIFGFAGSLFSIKNSYSILSVIFFLALLIASYYLKMISINFYLKSGKYPFEFLSVLEKFDLVRDVDIRWSENLINGPKESYWNTDEFLRDNNLTVAIKESDTWRNWKNQNDIPSKNAFAINFTENNLHVKDLDVKWADVLDWKLLSERSKSDRIRIQFKNGNDNEQEVMLVSEYTTIDLINLLLLLAHFKGKYGQ
jgi:hypothetical protein